MLEVPDIITEEFAEAARNRGEDPDEVLERLLLEYVRQNSTIAEIFADDGKPVQSIDEYEISDNRPLGKPAIKALSTYAGSIAIDPDDVPEDELPQSREIKREVIFGVLRYQRERRNGEVERRHPAIVRRDEVARAAECVVGDLDTDYKREEYVELVMKEQMIRNPGDDQMGFLTPADAMTYLDSLDVGEYKPEDDVYYLTRHLFEEYEDEVDVERLNEIREPFWFDPLD